MMAPLMLVVVVVVLAFSQDVSSQKTDDGQSYPCTYLFVFPDKIRPGQNLTGRGHILSASGPVNVQFSLVDVATNTPEINFPSQTYQQDAPFNVQLPIPDSLKDPGWEGYRLTVVGTGGLQFTANQTVTFDSKTVSVFVQTDKAKYRPGDTVLIRVLVTTPDLKVLTTPLDIIITDPNNNRIAQWLKVSSSNGVYENSLTTSTEPVLGTWKIQVKAKGQEQAQNFDIEKYVLPTYEVQVIPPSFVVSSAADFTGSVTAKYTFGKPVEGTAVVTIKTAYFWSSDGSPAPSASKSVQVVNGEGQFTFTTSELRKLVQSNYWNKSAPVESVPLNYQQFSVHADVIEALTGKTLGADGTFTVYDNPYTLSFAASPSNFKPGLTYQAVLKITKRDGSPLDSPEEVEVVVNVTYQVPITTTQAPTTTPGPSRNSSASPVKFQEQIFIGRPFPIWNPTETIFLSSSSFKFSPGGLVIVSVDVPSQAQSISLTATALNTDAYASASTSKSPSNNFIQLSVPADAPKPRVGQTVPFTVRGTEPIATLNYEVLSKGLLVASGTLTFNSPSTTASFSLAVTVEMAPSCTVLVYYTRQDGEVMADSSSVTIDGLFNDQIKVSASQSTVKPGEQLQVNIQALPSTLVYLLGVDRSVKLLARGNDIDLERVQNELNLYSGGYGSGCPGCRFFIMDFFWPYPSSGADAESIISGSNAKTLTNCNVYKNPEEFNRGPIFMMDAMAAAAPAPEVAMNADADKAGSDSATPARQRSKFLETWLWSVMTTDSNGQAVFTATAPDTITTYEITAIGVGSNRAFSVIKDPVNVTVFLPLFVRLEIPYSITHGEIACIQATAFNYDSVARQVFLSLAKSASYDNILVKPINKTAVKEQASSTSLVYYLGSIPSGSAKGAIFCISPRVLDFILLNFTMTSSVPVDAVSQKLLVKAEGVERAENTALLADLRNGTSSYNQTVMFTIPAKAVNGSTRVRATIIGDLMGSCVNNLGSLVQLPYGCGEQNMINFVPNIMVYNYLTRTNRLDDDLKTKIEDFTIQGYQRELQYQRNDGSFSAFGNSDSNGSLWLTLYCIKSFVKASSFITIDPNTVARAVTFSLQNQATNGSFVDPGNVIHKDLEGGSGQGEPLVAYAVIALTEVQNWSNEEFNQELRAQVTTALNKAVSYLEQQLPQLTDPYDLAIVTYALGLRGSPSVATARRMLEAKAIIGDGTKHYEPDSGSKDSKTNPWDYSASSKAVEATAYALCDVATQGDVTKALGLIHWLSGQRNPNGGYSTTQDTVVALECMSQFAAQVTSSQFALTVTVSWAGDSKVFTVNEDNSLLLQTQDLRAAAVPGSSQSVTVSVIGSGLATIDITRRYNLVEEEDDEAFTLTLDVEKETTESFYGHFCTSYNRGGNSTMAVMDIGIPSGYAPQLDETAELPGVKRSDVTDDGHLILYFDSIPGTPLCVRIPFYVNNKVARGQDNFVSVYDYYETNDKTTKSYKPGSPNGVCDVCQECGGCAAYVKNRK